MPRPVSTIEGRESRKRLRMRRNRQRKIQRKDSTGRLPSSIFSRSPCHLRRIWPIRIFCFFKSALTVPQILAVSPR